MSSIKDLQQILSEKNIAAYLTMISDFHQSEYVSDYFKEIAFLTDFTGSAGTLVVFPDKALLWVDGRYHIQAANQIDNKEVTLMKMGLPEVPTVINYLLENLQPNSTIAFDGRTIPTTLALEIQNKLKKCKISAKENLVDQVWKERPKLPFSMLFKLEEFYTGKNFQEKLTSLREEMKKHEADVHLLASLEDQAWLYNLRASDIKHTMVFMAYTIITMEDVWFFINEKKLDKTIEKYLKENDVTIFSYFDFYQKIKEMENHKVLVDYRKINYCIYETIVNKNQIISANNPTLMLKAVKNKDEIKSIINAHVKDGVAFTKWLYELKTNLHKGVKMTEISLADRLEDLRKEGQSFIDLSFDTICAYKEHAAIMHYCATPKTNVNLEPIDFLLVDSGAHYLDGTTDITRTISLGELTTTQKLHFTTVLKALIHLSQAVFLKGVNGQNLDILAREPIWQLLIDYKCGTGHGVGFMLSVHEGPNNFRWQTGEKTESARFEIGMVTTNEPGIYLEGKYGIRIENELLCIEKGSTEFGEFLGFETITYAPIDLEAIDSTLLTKEEKDWLNSYHEMVYKTISVHLNKDEKDWLKTVTAPIE